MIKLKNIKKNFGKNEILKNINLTINKGDVVAILGPSGTGKTTLLRCINFLEKADEGQITINEQMVDCKHRSKKRFSQIRRKTAMIFKNCNLFDNKTALENVMEELIITDKIPKKEAKEISLHELKKVGMENRVNYYPFELSAWQQQRVGIARALALKPDVILFDEPTSDLDPKWMDEVLSSIKKVADQGITMIIATHEMSFARNVSNHIVFMDGGEIIEEGSPKDIFLNPKKERTKQFLKRISGELSYVL